MNAQRCLEILREIKDVSIATVDADGLPRNRIIDIMLIGDEKLYFLTARGKAFYSELAQNGAVAITGLNTAWQMVRLHGRALKLDDQKKWIDKMFRQNPAMEQVYPGDSRYILEPFVVETGELEFFDLSKHPVHREYFPLGAGKENTAGYTITNACIACGQCANGCPQQCIVEGHPYGIESKNCLHCGLCFELCPVNAVEKR